MEACAEIAGCGSMKPTAVLPLPAGMNPGGESRRSQGRRLVVRGAVTGIVIAVCTLVLVLAVGPSRVKPGAVERRDRATADMLHTVLAGASMYTEAAGKARAAPMKKHGPMLEEEGEEPAGAGEDEREGEGEGEGEEEGEESEEAILVRWGFAFVTIIIVFSVTFEMSVEYIKEAVPEELEEVVSALLEELTTLGFLGFAFFLFTVPIDNGESLIEMASMYSLHEKEALKELFEGLHYLVFFVSLSFILCTIGGLATFHLTGNKQWTRFEEDGCDALGKPKLLEIDPNEANSMGGLLAEWKKTDEVIRAEYLRMRCRFIEESKEPQLDADFDFLRYLQQQVAETFSGMVKITPYDWLATWLLLALFFGIMQEGVTDERMLALYWYILTMIIVVCLLLQCKLVWIKQQLVPRMPAEMQSSARRSAKAVVHPVYLDQSTLGKKPFQVVDYIPGFVPSSITKLVKEYTKVRPGNKHERLFWFASYGPEVMSHMIRLSMFWTIVSLAMLMSHHMPGVVRLGKEVTGYEIVGHFLFFSLVALHLVAIGVVYRNARIFTLCTSIEMMIDKEMVEGIVREQKFAKCQKAISMLHTLSHYMQTVTALANAEQAGDSTDRSGHFEPKTEEEAKAYEELAELFAHFDSDGSGELGKDEVAELLATLGTTMNDEVIF